MDDLINRQAAIDALDVLCQEHRYKIPGKRETYSQYNEAWQDALDRAEGAIGNLPSVEAEPVRQTAEWIYGEKDGADGWYCSKCGFHIPWYYEYYGLNNINFIRDFHTCPHCDSKMMKYTGMEREQDG